MTKKINPPYINLTQFYNEHIGKFSYFNVSEEDLLDDKNKSVQIFFTYVNSNSPVDDSAEDSV